MSNVVLSIDGRKSVNDRVRKRVDGTGSYDKIIGNFKNCVSKRGDKEYYVRGTFTKYNLDFSNDVVHLYEKGFDQVSVEPVIGNPSEPYAITEKELAAVFSEYENLARRISEINKDKFRCNFFHFMLDLDQGPCAIKRLRGCGCGNEYIAITPDGDIYPCHQFVGHTEYKIVITSYSIHYTKLYDTKYTGSFSAPQGKVAIEQNLGNIVISGSYKDISTESRPGSNVIVNALPEVQTPDVSFPNTADVITSYSIHYTKLYESIFSILFRKINLNTINMPVPCKTQGTFFVH